MKRFASSSVYSSVPSSLLPRKVMYLNLSTNLALPTTGLPWKWCWLLVVQSAGQ